jgi:hypothetical protein
MLCACVLDSEKEGKPPMSNPGNDPIQSPSGLADEPTDSNPVPLSPTDPKRRTDAGDTPGDEDATDDSSPGIGGFVGRILPRSGNLGDLATDRPVTDDAVIRSDSEGQV